MLRRIVALLFALAVIAERAAAMPAPLRALALHFLRRGERVATSYVVSVAHDCGAPLQWALPDGATTASSREAALALAWWLRILAAALRDLPRRAFAVRMARSRRRMELNSTARPAGLPADRPIAFNTS